VKNKVAIICDFDGTVARKDIGHTFFERYVEDSQRREKLLEDWKLGLISSRECLSEEISLVTAGTAQLDDFIENETLDPYFNDFVDFCNTRKYEMVILSDGLDYYIDSMLMSSGLAFIRYRANHLVVNNGNILGVEFPWYNSLDCTMCGNCKKKHVEDFKADGFYAVYVGNGYSDRCPAEGSDMVFAKQDLLDHCRHEKISHIPFENFRDVERELSTRLKV